ncbi:unnamed protein product [Knipowitschia caucasica]
MSRKSRKEDSEQPDLASFTSTMTELLTTKLTEHKADLLAEIKETHTRYEAKLNSVLTIFDDHKRRIFSLELSANATSADFMGIQATLGALSAENAKLKAKVVDLEGRSRSNIRIGIRYREGH